jgi:hypothetical protein
MLVPDLGVDADYVGVFQLVDEGQRMTNGGQQDVAARLIGFRLDRKPQPIALWRDQIVVMKGDAVRPKLSELGAC